MNKPQIHDWPGTTPADLSDQDREMLAAWRRWRELNLLLDPMDKAVNDLDDRLQVTLQEVQAFLEPGKSYEQPDEYVLLVDERDRLEDEHGAVTCSILEIESRSPIATAARIMVALGFSSQGDNTSDYPWAMLAAIARDIVPLLPEDMAADMAAVALGAAPDMEGCTPPWLEDLPFISAPQAGVL